jgi:tetratricopeptide (TPR) repeat protein
MTPTTRNLMLAAAASVLALASGSAIAAGGGGMGGGDMGGGDMPSASGPQYDPVQEYQRGVEAMQASRYRDAARFFQHVVDAAPREANGWFMLGRAKAGVPDLRGARRAYERSIRLDATPIGPHRELGVTAAQMSDANAANAELTLLRTRATACNSACPEAADLTAAIAAIEAALAPVAPASAGTPAPAPGAMLARPERLIFASAAQGDASYSRAVSLINERRWNDALAALDQAEAAFGPHPDVLTYRGSVWRHLGDNARAERYYRQALAIAPNHIGATEYYGELKVTEGDMTGARQMLARLDTLCAFGCVEAETLRRWIDRGGDPSL